MFPPIPTWEGLHPLVVHFPIALLLIAPVFVLLGAASRRARLFSVSALILMVIGTVSLFLAVATGEAAEEQAERVASATLEQHEDLALAARTMFAILTGVFGLMIIVAAVLGGRLRRSVVIAAHVLYLAGYGVACVTLADAAHEGGRLVHEFGVHAAVGTVQHAAPGPEPVRPGDEDD